MSIVCQADFPAHLHSRTPALPHSRTPALPHSRTSGFLAQVFSIKLLSNSNLFHHNGGIGPIP